MDIYIYKMMFEFEYPITENQIKNELCTFLSLDRAFIIVRSDKSPLEEIDNKYMVYRDEDYIPTLINDAEQKIINIDFYGDDYNKKLIDKLMLKEGQSKGEAVKSFNESKTEKKNYKIGDKVKVSIRGYVYEVIYMGEKAGKVFLQMVNSNNFLTPEKEEFEQYVEDYNNQKKNPERNEPKKSEEKANKTGKKNFNVKLTAQEKASMEKYGVPLIDGNAEKTREKAFELVYEDYIQERLEEIKANPEEYFGKVVDLSEKESSQLFDDLMDEAKRDGEMWGKVRQVLAIAHEKYSNDFEAELKKEYSDVVKKDSRQSDSVYFEIPLHDEYGNVIKIRISDHKSTGSGRWKYGINDFDFSYGKDIAEAIKEIKGE